MSSAPWIFTKATKPVVTILRPLGMRIIIYIDDILVMAASRGTGSGADRVPDISVGESGVYNQSAEVSDRPHTGNRLPGSRCRFHSDGTQTTGLKDQEHPVRRQSAASESAHGAGSVKTAGQVDPCNPCNDGSPPPPPSSGTSKHVCKLPCSLFRITSNLAL